MKKYLLFVSDLTVLVYSIFLGYSIFQCGPELNIKLQHFHGTYDSSINLFAVPTF